MDQPGRSLVPMAYLDQALSSSSVPESDREPGVAATLSPRGVARGAVPRVEGRSSGLAFERAVGRAPRRRALLAVPEQEFPGAASRRAFGHSHDRRSVIEEEADAIRDAASRVLAGATLSSVVQAWNDRGLRTGTGGPWRVNSLSTLLLQPRLAGLDKDLRPLPDGVFPAILDRDTHARLVALHESRKKGPRRATRRYVLTGLLRCWRCGGNLRGVPSSRGSDLYICPGPPHGGCSGTAVTADRAEDAIRDLVLDRLDADDVVAAASMPIHPFDQHPVRTAALIRAERRQRFDELADMWASGQISRAEWLAMKRAADRRARQAEADTALLRKVQSLRRLAGTGSTLRGRWPEMTAEERRGVLHTVLDHVEVLEATPPRGVFSAKRLRPVWVNIP